MMQILGIEEYISKTKGIGGEIRDPEDFFVKEIIDISLKEVKNGKNLLIRVKKKRWETLNFVRILSNYLGISQKRIGFAGTKDKRAVTIQYFTISNVNEELVSKVEKLELKDAKIDIIGFTTKKLNLGDLIGNDFEILLTNSKNGEKIERIKCELSEKGIPNYFGPQRFGSLRFITHEVGKLIVKKEYEEAFWTYVAKPFEGENKHVRKIREDLWSSRDVKYGLKELPKYLRYERHLLQKLREGMNELRALLTLPKNLKLLFIHAYQSYLFNKLLSMRIREFQNLNEIERGDVVDFIDYKRGYKISRGDFVIVDKNISRVEFLRSKGWALLSLPLPGYETRVRGWCAEKLKELLEYEGVELCDFKSDIQEFSSKGSFRCATIPFDFNRLDIEIGMKIKFKFFLPKGCYATVFLREFTKI